MKRRTWQVVALLGLSASAAALAQQEAGDDDQTIELSGSDIQYEALGDDQIIIKGTDPDLDILQQLIERLDLETERPEVRVVQLENAPAADLAQKLQQLYQALARSNKPEDKITVVSDQGSNSLLIAAPAYVINDIVNMAEQLDRIPRIPLAIPATIELKYIKASDAVEQLNDALIQMQKKLGGARAKGEELQGVSIIPNDRNNTLLITAPPEDVDKIKAILQLIDVEPVGIAKAQMLFIPLINANAEELAESLSQMFVAQGQQAEKLKETILRLRFTKVGPDGQVEQLPELDLEKPIKIVPEPGTNSLIIATHDQNVQPVTEIVKLLDTVPTAPEMGIEFFPLRYADAQTLGEVLREMFEQGKELPKVPDKEIKGAVPEGVPGKAFVYNVGIHADTRINTIVVSGRPEQIAIAHTVITQLDVEGGFLFPTPRLYYLEHTDAERMANILTQLNEQTVASLEARDAGPAAIEKEKVLVLSDIRSNALIISATDEKYQELTELAQKLDGAPESYANEIRIVNCELTSSADLEGKIEQLWERKAELRSREDLPQDKPVIVSDPRSNSLVIASNIEDFEAIKRLIEELEAQPLDPLAMIRLIELENNDAGQMSDMLKQIFDERLELRRTDGDENNADKVAITADVATNTMLVACSPENYAEIVRIVERLDIIPDLEGVIRTFILENADAANVASKIKELFDQGIYTPALAGSEDSRAAEILKKLAIISDARANAIMVSASKPAMSIIDQLVQQMDSKEIFDLGGMNIFKLVHLDALKAVEILTQYFEGLQKNAPEGTEEVMIMPTIIPVYSGKAVIVSGTRDGITRAASLLREIDKPPVREMTIEVMQLQQASAQDLAETLAAVFEQQAAGQEEQTPGASFIISWFEKMEDGSEVLHKMLHQNIVIEAYLPTNSLMVLAPPESIKTLRSLITELDKIPPLPAEVEVFRLANANAEQTIQTLQEIFQEQGGVEEVGTAIGGIGGMQRELTFASDERTNSVIVAGHREYIQVVGDLIAKLDEQAPENRWSTVIPMNNSVAEEVAAVLDEYNQKERDRLSELEQTTTPYRTAEQTITVVPDEATNSILMTMSNRFKDQYMDIVEQLDRAPNQVLIECMFILVQLDDNFELGMEFAYQDLAFSEKAVVGPNGTIQGPNKDVVLGTDLGAIGSGGGFSLTITGEDFSFLFHALQGASRAELISRPSVMVEDNEEGLIHIFDQVPVPATTGADNAGNPITSVNYEEAGIELEVTPHINPDGFVQLDTIARIESVGASVPVAGVLAPTFRRTELDTTITMRDGETVILGGLIQTDLNQSETKVPLLGDLPWVGQLFRVNQDTNKRNELLAVLTVTVLRSEEDTYRASVKLRDSTDIIPDSIKESPLMNSLQVRPGQDVEIQRKDFLKKPAAEPAYGPQPTHYGPPPPRRPQNSALKVES